MAQTGISTFLGYEMLGDSNMVRFLAAVNNIRRVPKNLEGSNQIGVCVSGQGVRQLARRVTGAIKDAAVARDVIILIGFNDLLKAEKNILSSNILRPQYQNVTPSFADEVPFLVDGDSLMITVMLDKNWSNQLGGSSLHLVYLFERYLNIFVQRGGTFHIVFFENWRNIWDSNWNILLFRSILINHFSTNVPHYPVHLFDNCFDKNFANLVSLLRPGFILTNLEADGNCPELLKIQKDLLEHTMNINILNWLRMDLSCIDTNFIEVDVSTVRGYFLESNPKVRGLVNKNLKKFMSFVNNLPKLSSNFTLPPRVNIPENYDIRRATFLTAAYFFYENSKNKSMINVFLLTCALMDYFALKFRGCQKFTTPLPELEKILEEWHKWMFFALQINEKKDFDPSVVCDLWQGILFGHVCRLVLTSKVNNREELGNGIAPIYESMVQDFNNFGYSVNLYPIAVSNPNIRFENIEALDQIHSDLTPLSQMENELFLLFCGDLLSNIVWENPPRELVEKEYSEEHHYHNMKVIADEHDRTKDTIGRMPNTPWEKMKYLRRRDHYAKYMTLYGASIEGRPLTTTSIVRTSKATSKTKEKKEGSKAKLLKEAHLREKFEEHEKKYKEKHDKLKEQSKKYNVDLQKLLNDINILLSNKIPYEGSYKIETLLLKLKTLRSILKLKVNTEENKKTIFLTVREILNSGCELSPKKKTLLSKCLSDINCSEIAKRNNLPLQSEPSAEGDSWIRFQLEDLGPELVREIGGRPDSRVSGFIPDPWQSELFDIVDKRQSALIIAPTSSGKTYASYYCMEKVLREGTEGVVVYVAPTKALVNQVAATVYARFKDTKMPDGKSVYGVFTRDYRMYALNSQILVTVPQCLEILLLSPRRYSWVNCLRYVIFDEIHCIEGDIGGSAFERCLLLIRCPFLALSATIRNPKGLHGWLQRAEHFKQSRDVEDGFQREKLSYRVNLVIHSERHSDLTKYVYGNGRLQHLHPYSELESSVINTHKGIPSHMSLSPAETIQLYDTMFRVFPECESLIRLSPNLFFAATPNNGFISRNLVRQYASELSAVLLDWFDHYSEYFEKSIHTLKIAKSDQIGTGKDYIKENIPNFVLHLKEQNMLPALIFSYNRSLVRNMTIAMTDYFEKIQANISKMPTNARRANTNLVRPVEDRLDSKKYKMKELKSYGGNAEKNLTNISSTMAYMDRKNARRFNHMSSYKPLNLISDNADQSLQGVGVVDSEDIEFIEARLNVSAITQNHLIARSMRKEICMHHGGLNNRVRGAVEMLYRKKFLNVVFATGTLALGIHMPCRTTVIAGDSSYLNSLEYHQMAGRAGRRGYDTAGNVIFFGLNPRKQHSLMTAKLPSIKGNFPVTVSLILRTLLLVSDVTEKGKKSETATKVATSQALTMFENCLCYIDNPDLKIIIKHFFSFTLQLLQIQDFVNNRGEPLKWCGLATHLHYHEPGNLAFIYLLRTGVIRKICTETDDEEEVCIKLMITLCYLFTNIPLNAASKIEYKNSKVVLEPMPQKVEKALEIYNNQVRFVFKQYFANVANFFGDDDNTLPLSLLKIVGKNRTQDNSQDNLQTRFLNMFPPKLVCSNFAALSGNDDANAYSEETLISNLKQKMATDVKVIPLINLSKKLNAYALDFYKHGIVKSIVNDNGVKEGAEFTLLTDFLLVLKTIRVSLEEMEVKDENDIVYKYVKLLESNYEAVYSKGFGRIHL